MTLAYSKRSNMAYHPITKKLFMLMERKQTNLAVSADLSTIAEIVELADQVGPEICVLKTHVDIIRDFDVSFISKLQALAKKHDFIIFEDRKFADIGNTVKHQYQDSVFQISEWAEIVNAHLLPGPGVVEGLKEVGLKKDNGMLLLAEMSSQGNLITDAYIQANIDMALAHKDFVIGFIAQHRLLDDLGFITMTPGVKMIADSDSLGQQYLTPDKVIFDHGSDIIIVGRGIYQSVDPAKTANEYRQAGWKAYLKSIG